MYESVLSFRWRMPRGSRPVLLALAGALTLPLAATEVVAQRRTLCVHGVDAPQALNVRSGPGREHAIVGTFAAKSCDIRLAGKCDAGWCEMEQAGVRGFVDTRNIGVYEFPASGKGDPIRQPGAVVAAPPPSPPPRATVATAPPPPPPKVVVVPADPPLYRKAPRPPAVVAMEQGSSPGGGACVSRVERWDTLRIRTGPGIGHDEIGEIPSKACGVGVLGDCRGRWCRVTWRGRNGWANTYYLD